MKATDKCENRLIIILMTIYLTKSTVSIHGISKYVDTPINDKQQTICFHLFFSY